MSISPKDALTAAALSLELLTGTPRMDEISQLSQSHDNNVHEMQAEASQTDNGPEYSDTAPPPDRT